MVRTLVTVTFLFACLQIAFDPARATSPKFFPDDPVALEPDTADASGVQPVEIDVEYDTLENLFSRPGDAVTDVRAQNINTVDEVPDSSWYTNRAHPTPVEVRRGPGSTDGPAEGPWTVISAKSDGVSPGFTIRDRNDVWFLKFDPPGYRGMATGAEVVSGRLLWALGYNVPELHIASLRPDQLVIDSNARLRTRSGRRAMRPADVGEALSRAARNPDGSYRVVASRLIEGKVLGGFRFHGTRPDDPNDYVPHEHRRELRGYGTFAAWLQHVDAKSINSLDTVVKDRNLSVVKHYLLDFGSTIGSAGVQPREAFEGWEYLVQGRDALKGILGFGFYIAPWRTEAMFHSPAAGAFPRDNTLWDPDQWKPRYPNAAFLRARADDRFWAASKLQALTRDHIKAAIAAARYDDPETEDAILTFLMERRWAILQRYLVAANPIVAPALELDGRLRFANAAVDADVARAPGEYRARWSAFDNATGQTSPFGESSGRTTGMDAPAPLPRAAGTFVKVELSAASTDHAAWTVPVDAYFRREPDRWALVGFERMPQGNAPTPFRANGRPADTATSSTTSGNGRQ